MSSVWEPSAPGGNAWDDSPADASWTTTLPVRDDHDRENEKPAASEWDAEVSASAEKGNSTECRTCGEEGHFARHCPQAKCFNCDETGHSKAECPDPKKSGGCFNCGEEGHNKAECPNPRVFKGECRRCGKEGHPAAACPDKPPLICENCLEEGHHASACEANRKFDQSKIPDHLPEEAWAMMKKASEDRDMEDFPEALATYCKAVPDATWVDIEKRMRKDNFKVFFIALVPELQPQFTLVDLQGRQERDYAVSFQSSDKPMRAFLAPRWPRDAEENLERLANAGRPYHRLADLCHNCGELGHTRRHCKVEVTRPNKAEILCYNCNQFGHRVRDCPEERRDRNACRNCSTSGHVARDCPEPRSADRIECRECKKVGHFAKDCPNRPERTPRTCRNCGSEDHFARDCDQTPMSGGMRCRNCEQPGHMARECPEPKDWSKVKCNRCGEFGHTVKRCLQPEEYTSDAGGYESNIDDVQGDPWHTTSQADNAETDAWGANDQAHGAKAAEDAETDKLGANDQVNDSKYDSVKAADATADVWQTDNVQTASEATEDLAW